MFEQLRQLAIAHGVDIRIQDDGHISVIDPRLSDEYIVKTEDELLRVLECIHFLKVRAQ